MWVISFLIYHLMYCLALCLCYCCVISFFFSALLVFSYLTIISQTPSPRCELHKRVKEVPRVCPNYILLFSRIQWRRSVSDFKHFSWDSGFDWGSLVFVWSLIEPHIKIIVPRLLHPPPPYLSHVDTLLSILTGAEINGFLFQLSTDIIGFYLNSRFYKLSRALKYFSGWYAHMKSAHHSHWNSLHSGDMHSRLKCANGGSVYGLCRQSVVHALGTPIS